MKQYSVFVIDPPWPKKKGGLRKSRPNQGKNLDYAYNMIESLFPSMNRIDVFSREKREEWDQYGNQTDYFINQL